MSAWSLRLQPTPGMLRVVLVRLAELRAEPAFFEGDVPAIGDDCEHRDRQQTRRRAEQQCFPEQQGRKPDIHWMARERKNAGGHKDAGFVEGVDVRACLGKLPAGADQQDDADSNKKPTDVADGGEDAQLALGHKRIHYQNLNREQYEQNRREELLHGQT